MIESNGITKGLHNIENGESNDHHDHAYVKQQSISNEIPIPSYELNGHNDRKSAEELNSLNTTKQANGTAKPTTTTTATIPIAIPTEDSQPHTPYNCNINYTNESIGNGLSGQPHAHRDNGLAIIDVVNTSHTSNDQCKVATIKPTATTQSIQLPYSTQSTTYNNPYSKTTTENTSTDVDVNNSNASGPEESNRKQQKLSNKIVVLLRRSKPIALVVINSVLAVLIATSLCISMGMDYTIPAVVVGLIAVVASSGLWYWLYIAAVTAPRDIRYVFLLRTKKKTTKKKHTHNLIDEKRTKFRPHKFQIQCRSVQCGCCQMKFSFLLLLLSLIFRNEIVSM